MNGKIKISLVFPAQVRYNENRAWMAFLPEREKRMRYQKGIRTVLCAAVCTGFMACLAGCSVSFCGFRPGGTKELVFSCNEALPEEDMSEARPGEDGEGASKELPKESGEDASEARPADGRPEEREEAGAAPQEETQDDRGPEGGMESDGKVDLNSAGLEELMTLNGIGETRAKAILEYREQNGPFTKEEDIMQVQGIKEGIYSKIQNQIVVH